MDILDDKLKDDLRLARKVIMNSDSSIFPTNNYAANKPYWAATQNLKYIPDLARKKDIDKAFTILGTSDNVFELVGVGVSNIVAADTNPFAKYIYYLKKAAFKTLDVKEYISFILDPNSINFLDRNIFQTIVIYGFNKDEEKYGRFWVDMFSLYDNKTLLEVFFKPDFRFVKVSDRLSCMTYTQKKKFYQIKENLDRTSIDIHEEDALETLKKETETFMWVDITNILLYVFQTICEKDINKLREYVGSLESTLRSKLSPDGIFVIDYIFEMLDPKGLIKRNNRPDVGFLNVSNQICGAIWQVISEYFDITPLKYQAIPSSLNYTLHNRFPDQVVLARIKR